VPDRVRAAERTEDTKLVTVDMSSREGGSIAEWKVG